MKLMMMAVECWNLKNFSKLLRVGRVADRLVKKTMGLEQFISSFKDLPTVILRVEQILTCHFHCTSPKNVDVESFNP